MKFRYYINQSINRLNIEKLMPLYPSIGPHIIHVNEYFWEVLVFRYTFTKMIQLYLNSNFKIKYN